jgi:mannose-6-phosphate isomerase-like protein (cupin superfamily)
MEPILIVLQPQGQSPLQAPHEGEEFGYVLRGSIKIHLGRETYRAKKGESFYFQGSKEHYLSNPTKQPAEVLWVSTPPSF